MVRMDIVAGLKNAVERGYSLRQAQQTLINSGYNQAEIMEATNYLTGGLATTNQPQTTQQPGQAQRPQTQQTQTTHQPIMRKKKFPFLLVFLILILLTLVGFLVISVIFREDLIALFS